MREHRNIEASVGVAGCHPFTVAPSKSLSHEALIWTIAFSSTTIASTAIRLQPIVGHRNAVDEVLPPASSSTETRCRCFRTQASRRVASGSASSPSSWTDDVLLGEGNVDLLRLRCPLTSVPSIVSLEDEHSASSIRFAGRRQPGGGGRDERHYVLETDPAFEITDGRQISPPRPTRPSAACGCAGENFRPCPPAPTESLSESSMSWPMIATETGGTISGRIGSGEPQDAAGGEK